MCKHFLFCSSPFSYTLLQGGEGEGLDHFSCRFCFYHHHFSKDLPLPCFGCWLYSGFDFAEAWDCEHSSALHFLRCNFCEAVQDLSTKCKSEIKDPFITKLVKRSLHPKMLRLLQCELHFSLRDNRQKYTPSIF